MKATLAPDGELNLTRQPARYIGGEINSRATGQWEARKLRACLCFPDLYETGMSNLGLRILYQAVNDHPDCLADRVFAPAPDREEYLREKAEPLTGLETGKPLADFDFLGVTLASELTFTNLLTILESGGIPPLSADRGDSDPVVIAGGNGAFTPEPLADFCDAFFIGEGEEIIGPLLETMLSLGKHSGRAEKLRALAALPGFYLPGLYRPLYDASGSFLSFEVGDAAVPGEIKKVFVKKLEDAPFPTDWLVPWLPAVHDRISIEIMRGCVHKCRFCQARVIYGPCRARSPEEIRRIAETAFSRTGYEEIGLLSLSSGDYPRLGKLKEMLEPFCAENNINISFPSLRADTLDMESTEQEGRRKKTSLTLAPESSERLRKIMGKELGDEKLLEIAREARGAGWRRLKLYFMLGLPGEEKEDLEMIAGLLREIGSLIQVNAAFNTFIPKPHTPLERESMIDNRQYGEKTTLLKKALGRNRYVKMSFQPYFSSYLEALLCRGDRRVGGLIREAWRHGARLDGWGEHFRESAWREALANASFDHEAMALGEKKNGETLPWEHIRC